MSHPILTRLAVVAALTGLILTAGCSDQPRQPSEVELQAKAILDATFAGNAEDWFAVEKIGGKLRLMQLHHPKMSLGRQGISETERMNGLSERVSLTVTCRQYRWYDGNWSEWKEGIGANSFAAALMGSLLSEWGMKLEKKNGQWTPRRISGAHDFQSDRALLLRMMQQATR
jgi:hypothetical protein